MMSVLFAALLAVAAPAVQSEPITAGEKDLLAGTLTRPAGKARATMLILPGSGPTDRDGNSGLGITARPYRLLADGLAERGVATVRIDKRGLGGSKGAGDGNAVTIARYAPDTAAWVSAARRKTGAKCVWVAGHSEGGLIALASAQQPNICGLVLIAAPGRPFDVIIRAQLKANPGNAPILEQAFAALDSLKARKHVDTTGMHPALASGLFAPKAQDLLIDLLSYDPAALAKKVARPMLIVQGTRDIQISQEDAELLKAAQPKAQLLLVPSMNHVLKIAPSDPAANAATYADSSLPLAPGLVPAIADFVTGGSR